MSNILEQYRKQLELDKQNQNYDLPQNTEGENVEISEEAMEEYKKTLDRLRNSENDMEVQYKRFHETYKRVSESEFDEEHLKTEDVTVKVKRAFCPECGTEIKCTMPVLYNPYTLEKIARYDCPECGAKYNLEYTYPRIAYFDKDGNEISVV